MNLIFNKVRKKPSNFIFILRYNRSIATESCTKWKKYNLTHLTGWNIVWQKKKCLTINWIFIKDQCAVCVFDIRCQIDYRAWCRNDRKHTNGTCVWQIEPTNCCQLLAHFHCKFRLEFYCWMCFCLKKFPQINRFLLN